MGKLQPVLDGLTWLRDKGAGAVDGIQGVGSAVSNWWNGEPNPQTAASPKGISGSFLGGDIGRGFRRVGEQGPETIWNSKGGYVAHASATERLSRLSARAAPLMSALGGGLRRAMDQAQTVAAPVMQQVQQAEQTMTPAMMPSTGASCAASTGHYSRPDQCTEYVCFRSC